MSMWFIVDRSQRTKSPPISSLSEKLMWDSLSIWGSFLQRRLLSVCCSAGGFRHKGSQRCCSALGSSLISAHISLIWLERINIWLYFGVVFKRACVHFRIDNTCDRLRPFFCHPHHPVQTHYCPSLECFVNVDKALPADATGLADWWPCWWLTLSHILIKRVRDGE